MSLVNFDRMIPTSSGALEKRQGYCDLPFSVTVVPQGVC